MKLIKVRKKLVKESYKGKLLEELPANYYWDGSKNVIKEYGEETDQDFYYEKLFREVEKEITSCFCPICGKGHTCSEDIKMRPRKEPIMLWLSDFLIHRRIEHLPSHKRNAWARKGYGDGILSPHEEFERRTDEESKRFLLKYFLHLLIDNGITAEHFEKLPYTHEKTLRLARKKLADE